MSDPICKNCGKAKSEHCVAEYRAIPSSRVGGGFSEVTTVFICPTVVFQPVPEPLKAKPEVRYQRGTYSDYAYGTADGCLRRVTGPWEVPFALGPEWQEVTE